MIFEALTEKGSKNEVNEDYYLLPSQIQTSAGYLFIICDGLGGLNGGEVASKLTAELLFKHYYQEKPNKNIKDWFIEELSEINKKIQTKGLINKKLFGLRTTIVALLIKNDICNVFSVGDSRLYVLTSDEIKQITEDDSIVWARYKTGLITKDEILLQPDNNLITQAIGDIISPKVNSYEFSFEKNMSIFMCTDGIADFLTDKEIMQILNSYQDMKKSLRKIKEIARLKGSKDDITAILIKK